MFDCAKSSKCECAPCRTTEDGTHPASCDGVLKWIKDMLTLRSAKPGTASQRRRAIAHYERRGDRYGSNDRGVGLVDRFWNRWFRPREMQVVMETIDAQPGDEILDVGCGPGAYARQLASRGLHVVATDASRAMVELTRPLVAQALVSDIETLNLGRKFDRVICLGVLDFVADPGWCIANLAAHVEDGGRLVLLVPRRGLAGLHYRVAKFFMGVRVNAFDLQSLDRVVCEHGLVLETWRYPLANSIVARWRKTELVANR